MSVAEQARSERLVLRFLRTLPGPRELEQTVPGARQRARLALLERLMLRRSRQVD